MIRELRIRGLGVIDEAEVPFAPGFTVLTGETGAGKTMVLSGLGLIMGAKADAGVVRTGEGRADVDGEWLLDPAADAEALRRLDEAGAAVDEEPDGLVVLLGRSVATEGRSKALAGGRSVPASVLADVTSLLIAVHGQSDQVLLREPRRQRELLDRFGGDVLAHALSAYQESRRAWVAADAELRDLLEHRQEREREAAMLRHGIEEIGAVDPVAGEDDALKAQATVLAHATDLLAEVGAAQALLTGDESGSAPSAADLIAQARRPIDRAAALDPNLAATLARLDETASALDEAARELGAYAASVEADPEQLARVEDRRQLISGLKRRYGPGLEDVLGWWASAQRTVAEVDGADDRIGDLTAALGGLRTDLVSRAGRLTAVRREAAERLAAEVTAELQALAMADAALTIEVDPAAEVGGFGPDGADTVSMLLRPHAGSDPRPLGRGASGGELSRVMLAIEVVLAGVNSVPTFVFDEVDAGIGGKVAVEVGRRLARLARSAQVIVVTHLPQVAAFADRHIVVAKDRDGRVTTASVAAVDGPERVRELVRMLSGLEDSQSGADHAAELLALAAGERA